VARDPTIVALGGHAMEPGAPVIRRLLEATGAERPRVLFIPTATGDSDAYVARFHDAFGRVARASHLRLFGIPPPDIRGLVLDQDLVFVGGGNTANMLAVWKLHGLDEALHEAWRAGIVLAGVSAGAICWFEAGVTDSFRAELDGLDCLGFLPGSACPHYDGEEARRPAYHRLVHEGFPPGYALDDGCGLVFSDTDLVDVVTERAGARAYRLDLADGTVSEAPIEARLLT
jgi:dipeptidase E